MEGEQKKHSAPPGRPVRSKNSPLSGSAHTNVRICTHAYIHHTNRKLTFSHTPKDTHTITHTHSHTHTPYSYPRFSAAWGLPTTHFQTHESGSVVKSTDTEVHTNTHTQRKRETWSTPCVMEGCSVLGSAQEHQVGGLEKQPNGWGAGTGALCRKLGGIVASQKCRRFHRWAA